LKKTRQEKHKNIVGHRVREAREAHVPEVSQEDLSGKLAALGVQITQTGISRIENKSRYLMDYEAKAIAKALKTTVAWLFGEADKR